MHGVCELAALKLPHYHLHHNALRTTALSLPPSSSPACSAAFYACWHLFYGCLYTAKCHYNNGVMRTRRGANKTWRACVRGVPGRDARALRACLREGRRALPASALLHSCIRQNARRAGRHGGARARGVKDATAGADSARRAPACRHLPHRRRSRGACMAFLHACRWRCVYIPIFPVALTAAGANQFWHRRDGGIVGILMIFLRYSFVSWCVSPSRAQLPTDSAAILTVLRAGTWRDVARARQIGIWHHFKTTARTHGSPLLMPSPSVGYLTTSLFNTLPTLLLALAVCDAATGWKTPPSWRLKSLLLNMPSTSAALDTGGAGMALALVGGSTGVWA